MEPRTLAALKESIEHWRRLATGTERFGETVGASQCALCRLFYHTHRIACLNCPVVKRTGLPGCVNTPYAAADRSYDRQIAAIGGQQPLSFRRAAQKELEFLESLLPPENEIDR